MIREDKRGKRLYNTYHTIMPSFPSLTNGQLDDLVAYIGVHKRAKGDTVTRDPNALADPVADTIPFSGIVLALEPAFQVPCYRYGFTSYKTGENGCSTRLRK